MFNQHEKVMNFSEELKEYGFRFPQLAPVGFYLVKLLPVSLGVSYERQILAKLVQLFGQRRLAAFALIHKAQKMAMVTLILSLFVLFALLGDVDLYFGVFVFTVVGLIYYWLDKELDVRMEKRKRDMLIDFPEFVNTLALLVGAGLPLSTAMQKVVGDGNSQRPLYKELNLAQMEISAGKSMLQVYEDLAHRCKLQQITRFVSTVLQNINRGNADMVYVLRMLGQEAWENRKDIARKQGEEASSKLVFPLVMVFVAVAVIVLAPAIISMGRN